MRILAQMPSLLLEEMMSLGHGQTRPLLSEKEQMQVAPLQQPGAQPCLPRTSEPPSDLALKNQLILLLMMMLR